MLSRKEELFMFFCGFKKNQDINLHMHVQYNVNSQSLSDTDCLTQQFLY